MTATVTCLLATHGRFQRLRESLACFMQQTYAQKRLLILNQHPVPIVCDAAGVIVLNEYQPTLRHARFRQVQMADTEYLAQWDDDDIYLPHHLETAMRDIGDAPVWKPRQSWFRCGTDHSLVENVLEASWVYRRSAALDFALSDAAEHDEHPLFHLVPVADIVHGDLGARTSFIASWGDGGFHLSGSHGAGAIEDRTRAWRAANQDHGFGEPLTPAPLTRHWIGLQKAVDRDYPADAGWLQSLVSDTLTGHGEAEA